LPKEGAHGGTMGSSMSKTAPFDRSGTPPNPIVAEAGFARLRSLPPWDSLPKEGAHGGTMGSSMSKTAPFDRSGTPPSPIVAEADFARRRGRAGTAAAEREG
jgi:hypothetical protein